MSDTAQRLSKLRTEFSRLKAPDPNELAMTSAELSQLLGEIKAEGRALIEQLLRLARAGRETEVVTDIANRLERTLGRVKAQESH